MSLTEMVVSAIVKRGVLAEFRNFETTIPLTKTFLFTPEQSVEKEGCVSNITIKAENLTIRVDKEQ